MTDIGDIVTYMDETGVTRRAVIKGTSVGTADRWGWIRSHVSGDKILDIGCAEGLTFRNHPLASHVTGIDLDKWNPPGYAKFIQADAENLPFANEEFDAAILGEVLEHVANPVKILKEARRVAKIIWFTTPNEYKWSKNAYPQETIDERLKRMDTTYDEYMATLTTSSQYCLGTISNKEKPHLLHVRYWTLETLLDAFRQAGLEAHIEPLDYDTLNANVISHWSFFVGWAK